MGEIYIKVFRGLLEYRRVKDEIDIIEPLITKKNQLFAEEGQKRMIVCEFLEEQIRDARNKYIRRSLKSLHAVFCKKDQKKKILQ